MSAATDQFAQQFALWVYLSRTPLLWLTLTLSAYWLADRVSVASRRHPMANPVFHAIWLIGVILALTGTPYAVYFEGAQFVHFLLGPATVALAIPLYENRHTLMRSIVPMCAALFAGCVVAMVSAVGIAKLLGAPAPLLAAIAPKSVTSGVAMGIGEALGADPALTGVLVVLTGIVGALIVTPLMNAVGIRDWRARGFAAGLAAHGMGTARAFHINPVAGTFAGIALGLNALLTSILVPLVLFLFGH
jgi:predicted murein hydrolase (TIGR00659 family)